MTTFESWALDTIKAEDEKIDEEFIKEFMFSFESKEQFPIEIEKLVEWEVYSTKGHAVRALEKTQFEENKDFLPTLGKSTGGRPSKQIMLTIDCFKSLCIMAQNEKGKQIRDYYLILERLWKNHMEEKFKRHQELLKEIKKEMSSLQLFKYNNARKWTYYKFKRGLCIYVIESGEKYANNKQIWKFGISVDSKRINEEDGDVNGRLQSHRSIWPDLRVKLLIYTPHAEIIEKCLKHMNKNSEIIEINFNELSDRIFSLLSILALNKREYEVENVEPYNKGIAEPDLTITQTKKVDCYKTILDELSTYTVLQITEKLREFKLKIYGANKSIIKSRLKEHLEYLISSIREEEDYEEEEKSETFIIPKIKTNKNYTIRDLVPHRLTREEISDLHRDNEDKHYCNGFCQSLLSIENFHHNGSRGYHELCKKCRSLYTIADKKIISGELTPEQIKINPWLLEQKNKPEASNMKLCNECKEWKNEGNFDVDKCKCKDCRKLQAVKRNVFDCEKFVTEMTTRDIPTRNVLIGNIPKDRITILMKFLDIKRSSTDLKSTMVEKVITCFDSKSI